MDDPDLTELKYCILNPTGNITALVETSVPKERQPLLSARIMERHPEVEQVGFVSFGGNGDVSGSLRMAAGEFCGNASMCAAALYLMRRGEQDLPRDGWETVKLRVSGASEPVEIRLKKESSSGCFLCSIAMPPALKTEFRPFSFGELSEDLPVVFMQGISHIIIEKESAFYGLLSQKETAGQAVREWCRLLSADGLGLIFLGGSGDSPSAGPGIRDLTPLVFVPGIDSLFWENSCASGTAAAGIYLASKAGEAADISFREPGGVLRATSDPVSGITLLGGRVSLS